MKPDFYLHNDKFQELSDKAGDWYIKSWSFPYKSDEWQICRLKERICDRQAMKHLKEAQKYLYERI